MAILKREKNGVFTAYWTSPINGKQVFKTIGQREFIRAQKEGLRLEAEEVFWETANAKVFDFMAQNALSPDDVYNAFTHKAHIRKDRFKQMLREAGVKFKPSNQFKNRRGAQKRKKRYRWNKRLLPLEEILALEGSKLAETTVKARLDKGVSLEDAVSMPVNR